MVNKITTPPTTSELIGTVNEIIDAKQDVISDLVTIRSGAALGATALQPSALNGYATQIWVGQQGYLTGITSNDVTSALGYTPYDSENPDGYITSSALAPYATTSYVDTELEAKQDALVSGTNIKTINNTSILGSGNIDIQGGSSYTAGTGIDITNDVISVTNAISTGAALGATAVQPSDLATVATSGSYSDLTNIPTNLLKNTATASSALTISGIATNLTGAINIGTSSQATGSYGVSLGAYSYANGSMALGLGYFARATANYAIQLGKGTNSTASTLYVGFNTDNYLLLDGSTGLIPDARLSSNILRSDDLSGYATENWVNNQGYLTGITSSDVTSALGYTPYNATNPNGYITSSALSDYALDADVVHLTGTQAITGEKTFNNTLISRKAGSPAIACDDPNKIKGTAPSSGKNTVIRFRDTNGSDLGAVYHNYGTDKRSMTAIQVTKANSSSDTAYAQIGVYYPASGDPYAAAPASDVDGSIVTTVNKSKAANGYFQLGNGMIVNWGRISITANNATGSVTFPKAFTSTNYSITAAGRRSGGSGQGEISITETYSTTGFSWRSNAAASYYNNQQFWIAIGY